MTSSGCGAIALRKLRGLLPASLRPLFIALLGMSLAACTAIQDVIDQATPRDSAPALALNPADTCVQQRRALIQTNNYFDTNEVIGQFGESFLQGLVQGQSVTTALTSVVMTNLNQAITDVASGASQDTQQMQRMSAAFDALVSCRQAEGQVIRANYNGGQISYETAQAQMEAVRTKFLEDLAYARTLNQTFAARSEEFQVARRSYRTAAVEQGVQPQQVDVEESVAVNALTTNQETLSSNQEQVMAAQGLEDDPNTGFVVL